MKKIGITICLIILALGVVAQQPDTILAKCFYVFKHLRDTTKKDSFYTENMLLAVGKNASVYTSFDKIEQAQKIQKQQQEQIKNNTGSGAPRFKYTGTRQVMTTEIYQFQTQRKMFTKEFVIRNYLFDEPLPEIAWQTGTQTKDFSGIRCQQATANFKGRQWTVWFAPDIPFQAGPWKLNGLPGLIIDAIDSKNEVSFRFAGFESGSKTNQVSPVMSLADKKESEKKIVGNFYDLNQPITLPQKAVKTTKEEVEKTKATMYKNPRGFFMAQLNASGGFVDDEAAMENFSFNNIINNPIEIDK